MRVSIITREADERSDGQGRLFTAQGHPCQHYVQADLSAQETEAIIAKPASFLRKEHVRDTAVFLYGFTGAPYPLLDPVKHIQRGLVVLDLRGATRYELAPVPYADLCIVDSMSQKRALWESTGCAPERIAVLPLEKDSQEKWAMTIDQAMRGEPPEAAQAEVGGRTMALAVDDLDSILLIRDTGLDRSAMLDRVRSAIERRLEAGGYGPDVSCIGPQVPGTESRDGDDPEQAYAALLGFQTVLDDLATSSQLTEPEFRSVVPLVGPVIVAVRRFWNWMSAKWYVRGWMSQQAAFNARAVEAIEELRRIQERNERRIHDLELEMKCLRGDE
jgi:hypothetical protein